MAGWSECQRAVCRFPALAPFALDVYPESTKRKSAGFAAQNVRLWFLLCVQRSQVNLQTIRCHEVHKVCTKCILVTVYVLHCECFHQVTIMAILNLIVGVAMTMSIVWLIVSGQWNT